MNYIRNNFRNIFKGISKPLLILPFLLGIISLIMMISISYSSTGNYISRPVIVQATAYFLGIILVFFIANMEYSVFEDLEKWVYIGSLGLLLLVYIPGLGVEQFGATSWINLRVITVQPSEIVKITFIFLFATHLKRNRNKLYNFAGVLRALIYCLPFLGIMILQDFGSALVFLAIWVTMLFYAGIEYSLFAKCVGATVLVVPFTYKFMASHQKERIDAFLHPDNLTIGANYHVYMSKIAIGSGGFFGKGLFHGTQKGLDFLPVQSSDFIFAVIIEELGFVSGFMVILLFGWFIYAIMQVSRASKDFYSSLIIMGIIGMFTFQIFENIAMTMGLMPVTGITLPFISYGGTSILSNMIAYGLVLNVAIQNRGIKF